MNETIKPFTYGYRDFKTYSALMEEFDYRIAEWFGALGTMKSFIDKLGQTGFKDTQTERACIQGLNNTLTLLAATRMGGKNE